MFSLVQKLLATRKPSLNYSLFLSERLVYFQLKAIKDGRPHEFLTVEQFVKTFAEAPASDQYLLCELYLHNEAMPENRQVNLTPIVGDVQISAFVSFLANQITWQTAFIASRHNEDNRLLWIRPEPSNPAIFVAEYHRFLQKPGMRRYIKQLQASTLLKCQQLIRVKETAALKANTMFFNNCTMRNAVLESSPYVGSSRRIKYGSIKNSCPMHTHFLSPPEILRRNGLPRVFPTQGRDKIQKPQ